MSKFAIINNGVVANIAESDFAIFANWILCDDTPAYIGGIYDENASQFLPPPIIPPHEPTVQEMQRYILDQIEAMEIQDRTCRFVRESLIVFAQTLAQLLSHDEEWLLQNNIAYQKCKARDDQIRALRAEYLLLMSGG